MISADPLEMARKPDPMAGQTILRGGKTNVRFLLAVGVETPTSVTGLAVRVVRRHQLVALHRLMANRALFRTDHLGAHDRFHARRPERSPFKGDASGSENRKKDHGCGGTIGFHHGRESIRNTRMAHLCPRDGRQADLLPGN
jgi:hypothetical protein